MKRAKQKELPDGTYLVIECGSARLRRSFGKFTSGMESRCCLQRLRDCASWFVMRKWRNCGDCVGASSMERDVAEHEGSVSWRRLLLFGNKAVKGRMTGYRMFPVVLDKLQNSCFFCYACQTSRLLSAWGHFFTWQRQSSMALIMVCSLWKTYWIRFFSIIEIAIERQI